AAIAIPATIAILERTGAAYTLAADDPWLRAWRGAHVREGSRLLGLGVGAHALCSQLGTGAPMQQRTDQNCRWRKCAPAGLARHGHVALAFGQGTGVAIFLRCCRH